jgi:hypothetical protein
LAVTAVAVLPGLAPAQYRRHAAHAPERIWLEKNCYVDIWLELLHALGLDPMAMLAFTVAIDFHGDQWTFFKPPHQELHELYGIEVHELYLWRPLLEHALEHLAAGRLIATEADAYWLPDTAGSDYRAQHTKTTIVLNAIDAGARRLDYFHNAGYHRLEGEDFAQLFGLEGQRDPAYLPLFAELVCCGRLRRESPAALQGRSRVLLDRHLQRLPERNPVRAFDERFAAELARLSVQGLPAYHAWAFGTLRQLGAAAELSALYLCWLEGRADGEPASGSALEPAVQAYLQIAAACKTLILKAARAVNQRRALAAHDNLEQMAGAWECATAVLRATAPQSGAAAR